MASTTPQANVQQAGYSSAQKDGSILQPVTNDAPPGRVEKQHEPHEGGNIADRKGDGADISPQPPARPVALSHDTHRARVARTRHRPPDGATVVTTYRGLKELLHAFAAGLISLLAIVARPGLSKSQLARQAVNRVKDRRPLIIKLRKSALDFYTDLHAARDQPVILDDDDDLMSDRLCREYIKALTETEKYKRLEWGTKTKILAEEGVPKHFWTSSAVCLIANHWSSRDPICQALESRAEFVYFDPDWSEVYCEVGEWFWDQEIYDYVCDRLDMLKPPDMRLFVKAYNRKKAGLVTMDWRKLIDEHVDDGLGLVVRRLLDEKKYESNEARAEAFRKETKAHRATFYRRLAQIKRYRPRVKPERIILKRTVPPDEARPADGVVPGSDAAVMTGSAGGSARSHTTSATESGRRSKNGNGQLVKQRSSKSKTRKPVQSTSGGPSKDTSDVAAAAAATEQGVRRNGAK